jgi:hypothetical protein
MATKAVQRKEKYASPQQTTVLEGVTAARVELALVSFRDEYNRQTTQFALVGKNTVHMVDGKTLGTHSRTQKSGPAAHPLRNAIFRALGREIPSETESTHQLVATEQERD